MLHLTRHMAILSVATVLVWTLSTDDSPKYAPQGVAQFIPAEPGWAREPSALVLRDAARSVIGQLPVRGRRVDVEGVASSLRRSLAPDDRSTAVEAPPAVEVAPAPR